MSLLVVRARRGVPLDGLPPGATVVDVADVAGAERGDATLVVGSTADVAAVVAALPPDSPIAFAHCPEVCRLFAVDPGLDAALQRAARGATYPVDLGWVAVSGTRRAFLGAVTGGAGARRPAGFPWAGRDGDVMVQVDGGRSRSDRARAVTVSNLQHWGDWTLSPRSAPNDGKVEVQWYTGPTRRLWRVRQRLSLGLHGGDDGVRRSSGAVVEVQAPPRWRVVADGVTVGRGGFTVTVESRRATLLI